MAQLKRKYVEIRWFSTFLNLTVETNCGKSSQVQHICFLNTAFSFLFPQGSAPRQLPGQSHSSFPKDSLASLDNRLWNYKPSSSSSAAVSSSAATGFVVDYGHRVVVPEFGKTPERPIRNAKPSQAFSSHGQKEHRGLTKANQRTGFVKVPATIPSSSAVSATAPTEKQAKDFHGRQPSTFPYNCSLCNITVLSESVSKMDRSELYEVVLSLPSTLETESVSQRSPV